MEQQNYSVLYCPYNYSHRLTIKNFLKHIQKCSSASEEQHKFQTCRYNLLHVIKKEEIDHHENYTCPDMLIPNKHAVDDQVEALKENAFNVWKERQMKESLQSQPEQAEESKEVFEKNSYKEKKQLKKKEKKENNYNQSVQQNNQFHKNNASIQISQNIFKNDQNEKQEEEEELKNNSQQDLYISESFSIFDSQSKCYFNIENSYDACYQVKKSNIFKNNISEFKNMILKKMEDLKDKMQYSQSAGNKNNIQCNKEKQINQQPNHIYDQLINNFELNNNYQQLQQYYTQNNQPLIQNKQSINNRNQIQIDSIPYYKQDKCENIKISQEDNKIHQNQSQNQEMRGNRQIKIKEIQQDDQNDKQDRRNNLRTKTKKKKLVYQNIYEDIIN